MPKSCRLLRGDITYSVAKEDETNVLHQLAYWDQKVEFFNHLEQNRDLIRAAAAHHLGLGSIEGCHVAERNDWLHGSFNLCIPITVENWRKHANKRVIMRFPLPYRVGEAFHPGNADEKLRCEAGAYSWLQQNCPTLSIPRLYGFGLSKGQRFTALENLPVVPRYLQYLRRQVLTWLGYQVPSRYVRHQNQMSGTLSTGYLLIEYIEEAQGRMLSNTWNERHHETTLRTNLFRGLSRIFLTLSRVPLPRIGSFTLDDDGFLNLSNRPLTLDIQNLENEQIPVGIPRGLTYSTVHSFVADTLSFHDNRLRHQPNAVQSLEDGLFQMAALTGMKTVHGHFFQRDLSQGPFVFSLTDLHQSNLFVDDNWNIRCIVDLEWACSRPVEMLHPPYWLTSQPVDGIDVNEYEKVHKEFMDIFEEEETSFCANEHGAILISSIMKRGWELGTFWYSLALESPTGLFRLFYEKIQPIFAEGHMDDKEFYRIFIPYWSVNARKLLHAKVKDKEDYDKRLREAFED